MAGEHQFALILQRISQTPDDKETTIHAIEAGNSFRFMGFAEREFMSRRFGVWIPRLLLVVCSLALTLGVAEVVLRVRGFRAILFHRTDAITGRSLMPGAEGWYTTEGQSYVKINSHGLRDHEVLVEKPAGCIRIAVLGDSFAEAVQVPLENSFPKVLEHVLNDGRDPSAAQFQVINFGVSGFGTGSELLALREKVWEYQPDIVVLAMFLGNDIRDNSRELSQEFDLARPFFSVDDNGALQLDNSFRDRVDWKNRQSRENYGLNQLINSSALLQLMHRTRFQSAAHSQNARPPVKRNAWDEPGTNLEVFREPRSETWKSAWETTRQLISAIDHEVQAHQSRLVVATLSIQVHPDPRLRQQFKEALGIEDEFYPDRQIAVYCRLRSIPVITLAPRLQQRAQETGVYLHGFDNSTIGKGHWNEAGHAAAGRFMAERIREATRQPTVTASKSAVPPHH